MSPGGDASGIGPAERVGFEIGQEVGGRFVVEQILGTSEGGTSYLVGERSANRKMVLKVLDIAVTEETAYQALRDRIKEGSQVRHKNLMQVFGLGREGGAVFVAMEYVEGQTLSRQVSRRREVGQAMSPRSVLNIIAHVCQALQVVHETTVHGTLTPLNVYVTSKGKVKVSNLVFGRIVAEALYPHGQGLFQTSPFVAPEVRANPAALSPLADVYSVGLLTAELLSSSPLEPAGAGIRARALEVAASYGPDFAWLMEQALAEDPSQRMRSVAELREALSDVIDGMVSGGATSLDEEVGAASVDTGAEEEEPQEPLPAPPPEPAPLPTPPKPAAAVEEDPFARAARILSQKNGGGASQDNGESRYLTSKDGLDYGPYTRDQVVAQLQRDEVDEFTIVLDRITQERVPLGDMPVFRKAVEAYLPVREERRRREQEQREKVVETAKTAGKWTIGAGVLGGVLIGLLFAGWWFFIRPQPAELPQEVLFADLGTTYRMEPPPREFSTVTVDKDLMSLIFAKDEPAAARRGVGRRVGRRGAGPGGAGAGFGDDENVSTLDLGDEGSDGHVLTDEEINGTIRQNFGGVRECILSEFKRNPGFKGVTVQFFIKPSGSTGGVQIIGSGGAVAECLKGRFRAMSFPKHGGLNKGVTYPLRLQ